MILAMLPEKAQRELFEEKEHDFSFTYHTSHRFRGNCFVTQGVLLSPFGRSRSRSRARRSCGSRRS